MKREYRVYLSDHFTEEHNDAVLKLMQKICVQVKDGDGYIDVTADSEDVCKIIDDMNSHDYIEAAVK